MKRTLFLIITIFALLAQTVIAQSYTEQAEEPDFSKVTLNISFFDRTMYYPGDSEDNPVYVHVSIVNNGPETLRFELADDRAFSIDFSAFTVKNTQLVQTQNLIAKRTTSKTVYFREISLGTGEEYSFVENVKDYLVIDQPSIYYLELYFYPKLYRRPDTVIKSNRLSLEIHSSPSAAASRMLPVEAATAAILQPEAISPDRVVEQTIIARQREQWDKYFLYMDVEQMLLRDPVRSTRYRAVSADERDRMIENYKADLMQSRIDNDIVSIPSKFQIEKTVYTENKGTVTVLEWFKNDTFTEKKRYTYEVHQRDGIWLIDNYKVDNLGNE